MNKVFWRTSVDRQLERIPSYIRDKFHYWVDLVERYGLAEIKKIKGFKDELLKGVLFGKRSIRLNSAYRVIYIIIEQKVEIQKIEVLEITKHEYKK